MKINKNKKVCPPLMKGVTLIELMVVIAIVGIMSAVILVSMSNSRTAKEVEVAAREVAANIRNLQNAALAGKDYSAGCNYQLNIVDGDTYRLDSCLNENYDLRGGVGISPVGVAFYFTAPHAAVYDGGGVALAAPFDITLSKGGSAYHVCVSVAGTIEDKASCP